METLFYVIVGVLSVACVGSFVGMFKCDDEDGQMTFGFLWFGFTCCLLLMFFGRHNIRIEYENFIAERNAFEFTLKNARENGNQAEIASIVRDVVKYNTTLAKMQLENSRTIDDIFTDDRFDSLTFIK